MSGRNLPLGFALVLAGAVMIQRGWAMFGSSFGGDGGSSSSAQAATSDPGSVAGNRRLGLRLMRQRFPQWARDPRQWVALDRLWTRESGWSATAQNPTSPAYGIPQDITGNHHGGAAGQIIWGLNYIKQRYGSPLAAWQHEEAAGWY